LRYRYLSRTLAFTLAAVGLGLSTVPGQADAAHTSCQDVNVPVSLLGTSQTLYGKLCAPDGARTVQVLVPGASYNSSYWDYPYTPEVRSYRLAMNKAGYATFTLDRLGTGRSSKPASALLTSFSQATVVHQAIQALRTGNKVPSAFSRVILGGHSVGSAITMIEAGTYHDVDGVLITGLTHGINEVGAVPILSSLIPAALDPKFAAHGLDLGYLTTAAGTRYDSFHKPGLPAAGVDNADEATKDQFAPGEVLDTVLLGSVLPYSKLITVPVMLVMGKDPAFCGFPAPDCSTADTLRAAEAPDYAPAAKLQTFVVRDYGHALNLAPDAPWYHLAVVNWADSMVGH